MSRSESRKGQALIEFALIFPLLFLLVVNVVNFGTFLYGWITIANAARTGAQYMVLAEASVKAPRPASAAQIAAVITADVAALLNNASVQVRVCSNNNGTSTCAGPGSHAPADPEGALYVLATVDVTYTYQPAIPLWDFSSLGIHATLPATTIHRRSVMRMLQ